MKIRCDVCDQAEASVFCSADEAALCDGCDHRVHHANKLASKHVRFSVLQPNSLKEGPLCDICQERRAFLFCREDRAILCRECDIPIHRANEHTQKHSRFLLTGVKVTASSPSYPTSTSSTRFEENLNASNSGSHPSCLKKFNSASNRDTFGSPAERPSASTGCNLDDNPGSDNGSISTSSISEYLETLPGWKVDDFLDPSLATNGFNKTCEPFLSLVDQDLESYESSFSPEGFAFWVPQVSPKFLQVPLYFSQTGMLSGSKESKEANNLKVGRKCSDNGFTVPQISPPSLKRSRHFL